MLLRFLGLISLFSTLSFVLYFGLMLGYAGRIDSHGFLVLTGASLATGIMTSLVFLA